MRKTLFISLFSVLFFFPEMISGQDGIKIRGKVTNQGGISLIDANIIILNSSYGTSTDKNGFYFVELPPSKKGQSVELEVSYLGYVSQSAEITLSAETTFRNFILEEDVLSLKKVVVSAQRREENLQIVPVSITAIESDKIQNKGANQVIDLRYSVPNLTFGTGASYAYGMITSIRGIAGTSFIAGLEPRSAVYVDDVYTGRTISFNQDLMEIERITVLRGPQGTLFGKNSISGLINISTRKPQSEWKGSVIVEGGNYNFLSTKVLLNIPVIENKFFVKLAGKFSRRDGYVTNLYNNKNMNGENIFGARLQARYFASDKLEFLLNFDGIQNTMDPRTEAIINDGSNTNPRKISHDAEEFDYLDLYRLAFTLDYQILNGHHLNSITAFRWNNNRNQFDLDVSPLFVAFGDWRDTTRLFTQEFRLTSPSNQLFDYIAGLYYSYQSTDKTSMLITGAEFPVPEYNAQSKALVKTNSISGYLNGNLQILKNLTLTAGLRYTYEYKTVQFDLMNDPQPIFYIDVNNYTDTYSKSVLSPKVGLNFSLFPDVFLYGFVAQGFTSGGWNVYFINTLEHLKFMPEYATSYELGLKTNILNNKIIANLSAYITKFRDYQVNQYFETEDGVWEESIINAGKVFTKGFELDVSLILFEGLIINGGWGYADARFDKFKNAGGEGIHYDGNRLPWSPKNGYNISIEYKYSISNFGSVLIYGEFVHQGNYFCQADNNVQLSFVNSHELLNARIGFHFEDNLLGISIWGRNLLDKLYLLDNSPVLFDTPAVWYGPPRMFGVEVNYNFLR